MFLRLIYDSHSLAETWNQKMSLVCLWNCDRLDPKISVVSIQVISQLQLCFHFQLGHCSVVHWRLCIHHLSIHAWNRRTHSLFPLPCNNTIPTDCHTPLEQNMCTVWDLLIMSSTYSFHQTLPCISTSSLSNFMASF